MKPYESFILPPSQHNRESPFNATNGSNGDSFKGKYFTYKVDDLSIKSRPTHHRRQATLVHPPLQPLPLFNEEIFHQEDKTIPQQSSFKFH